MARGSQVTSPVGSRRFFLATAILGGLFWSLLECLDLQATGAITFTLSRHWPLFWIAHLSIGIAACLVLASVLELGVQLATSSLHRWTDRPDRVTGVVLFGVNGLVWAAACRTGLFRDRALITAGGLAALAGAFWLIRGPLPWRADQAARPRWLTAIAGAAVVVAAHLFNRTWYSKIYFPLHVAASTFSLTAALYAVAPLWRAVARPLGRPLTVGATVAVVVAGVAFPMIVVGISNDVRQVLFTRAFDAKSVLYMGRKLRGAGYRPATAMPATSAGPTGVGHKRVDRVLFLSIDTVRADHLPIYGYGRDTAPEISAFARGATVFDWAWAAGAHTSLALHAIFGAEGGRPPLTQILDRAGIGRQAVLARLYAAHTGGFDRVTFSAAPDDASVAETAVREIGAGHFTGLMWVHFSDPHRPYQRHPDVHFGDRPVDLYDGEIHSADAAVGRVLRALTQAHLDDTTAVFVVADHGEEFGEHGGEAHGWDIYDELIHVPLVVRLPGSPVGRVRAHVTQRDLPFTITDLLGIGQPPPGEDHSLVPLLDARADDRAAAIGPLSSFDVGALMAGRWKLAYCLFNDSRALYDLAADPAERVNLFEARPQVARRMDELLRRFLADPAHVTPPLVADGELRW